MLAVLTLNHDPSGELQRERRLNISSLLAFRVAQKRPSGRHGDEG